MTGEKAKLSRARILRAALSIIDTAGLEACTMRAVASDLGVEAMSLYWHVPGKEALLDGVVETVLAEVAAEYDLPAGGWREGMEGFAGTFHAVIMRHPHAVSLIAGRPLGAYAAATSMAERGIGNLQAAGFDRVTAVRAVRSVVRYVVGFAIADGYRMAMPEPPATDSPEMNELLTQVAAEDPHQLFTFGLELILDGLELRLRRA